MPDRRAKLLDEVADYILSNGLADLSLRPLAAAINTSPRMLLYFFGTKERLSLRSWTATAARAHQAGVTPVLKRRLPRCIGRHRI